MNTDSLIHFSFYFTSFLVVYETEDLKTKEYLTKGNYNVAKWFNKKKIPIFKVSEFLILPYIQNRKLGNLGEFSLT